MKLTKSVALSGTFLAAAGTAFWSSQLSRAQDTSSAATLKTAANQEMKVAEFPLGENGLYFGGKKGVDYAFGPRITPHGDCITAIPGYVFVSWYKGPRSDRHLNVSRLNLATGKWKHVELPERNTVGHRKNCPGYADSCGESHRTAAVGVSPLDGTVHLIFDMHADDLQYIVSRPGTADLPDEAFSAARFNAKQDGFARGKKLQERITYPGFDRNDKGQIFAMWREGGSGSGNTVSSIYEAGAWSKPSTTWFGKYNDPTKNVSIYGSQKYLHGRMFSGFSIRTPTTEIELNQGLYFAEGGLKPSDDWIDLKGAPHPIPVRDYSPFMVDEPVPSNDFRMGGSPQWTVSKKGDVHMIVSFTAKPSRHYYRPAGTKTFHKSARTGAPGGALYSVGDRVFAVGEIQGRLEISSTPAGKDEWKKIPVARTPKIAFGNSVEQDGILYFFAMEEVGNPQSQPLTLLALDLKKML